MDGWESKKEQIYIICWFERFENVYPWLWHSLWSGRHTFWRTGWDVMGTCNCQQLRRTGRFSSNEVLFIIHFYTSHITVFQLKPTYIWNVNQLLIFAYTNANNTLSIYMVLNSFLLLLIWENLSCQHAKGLVGIWIFL